jgi:hypothetical protein
LDGLDRLLKNNGFSYDLDEHAVKDLYEKNSDSVSSFIFNKINTENDEGVITKRDTHKAYVSYCRSESLTPVNHIRFGREFKEQTGCGVCKQGKIPAYGGVVFKNVEVKQQKIS